MQTKMNFLPRRLVLILLLNIIFLLMVGSFYEIAQKCEIKIYTYGNKNEEAISANILLSSIIADGQELRLSEIPLQKGETYDPVYDDIIINNWNKEKIFTIALDAFKEITLTFGYSPESGIIGIQDGENYTEIDLYNSEYSAYQYIVKSNLKKEYLPYVSIKYFLMTSVFSIALAIVIVAGNKLKVWECRLNDIYELLKIVILNYVLLIYSRFYYYLKFEHLLLISSLLLWGMILEKKEEEKDLKIRILKMLIAIWFTLSFFGETIFLPLNKSSLKTGDLIIFIFLSVIVYFMLSKIINSILYNGINRILYFCSKLSVFFEKLYLLFGIIWVISIAVVIYYFFENDDNIIKIVIFLAYTMLMCCWIKLFKEEKNCFKAYFVLSLLALFPLLLIFNPGNMTADSFDQIGQIWGVYRYSDHHPIMHTMFEKLLLFISGNRVITITAFQIILYSFVCAKGVDYLDKKGMDYKGSYVLLFIMLFWPATVISIVTLWKDILFSIALLWLIILLAEMQDDIKAFWGSRVCIIEFLIALFMVSKFRHNGLLIAFVLFVGLVVKMFQKRLVKGVIMLAGISLFILGTQKVVVSMIDVIPNGSFVSVILFHGLAYEKYMGEDLLTETQEYLEGVIDEPYIKELYSPYTANPYIYSEEAETYGTIFKFKECDLKQVLQIYLREFARNPYLLIKDRLYGTDLLWNVHRGKASGAYNGMYTTELGVNEIGIKRNYIPLENCIKNILRNTEKFETIFWRGGLHLNILLILMIVGLKNRGKQIWLILCPIIMNVISLFLSMAWQDYRYVWFLWLVIPFIFGYTVMLPEK